MIISASRRTDIPNYYSEWFFNRVKEKYVLVRNPINKHQISKIDISPNVVDCIVFWTKNPKPMLEKLDLIREYKYYFQYTITSYGKDIETNLPSKNDEIIDTFKMLSDKIGREKVVWRYDPILITEKYNIEYHIRYFEKILKKLSGYTDKCIISFVDLFKKVERNNRDIILREISYDEQVTICKEFINLSEKNNISIETCAEKVELDDLGVRHAKCIDDKLISKIVGYDIKAKKDKNQRLPCGCIESIDIGAYNTCLNGCSYCYANYSKDAIENMRLKYSAESPLLCDSIKEIDHIIEKKVKSFKVCEKQPELAI